MRNKKAKIIILIGQTASGKTSTAIALAKKINGEIISADSRQVYKGLDIGTDKVTKEQMQGVPHHLIDVADPIANGSMTTGAYTASDFVYDATKAIKDIVSRGKVPIIAGGTMLYIDALMGRVAVPNVAPNPQLRKALEQQSPTLLFAELKKRDPRRAEQMINEGQDKNQRRIIRALEIVAELGSVPPHSPNKSHPIAKSQIECGDYHFVQIENVTYEVLWIGLQNDPIVQKEKINKRNAEMLEHGLLKEVKKLIEKGVTQNQFNTLGFEYKYPAMYLFGTPIIKNEPPTLKQVLMKMNSGTWRYAKKQRSWWQNRDEIIWQNADKQEKILKLVRKFLNTKN